MRCKFYLFMKYFFNILFLLISANGFCQVWTNNGSVANILPGTVVNTSSLENLNGTITNSGNLTLKNNYNNIAIVNGSGDYNIGGNWVNNGTFTAGLGVVTLNGIAAQNIFSTNTFNNISINKTSGNAILSSDITVDGTLNFISGNVQTGSNKIIISPTGNITGSGQTTGWINGNLQKSIQAGSPLQVYEVGGNNFYTPTSITLNGVTTGGSLVTAAIATDHPNLNTSSIDGNKSVNRYYKFTNNGIVFTDAGLTLNWESSDVDAGASTANFKVALYNGSSWIYPAIASPNATSIQVTGITSFGDFAVGESLSALPVNLYNLRGYSKNQGIQVEWITQSEINMERYEIERSANGQQFTKIGSVAAKGNSSFIYNYSWFDANPLNGINYYRIISVEKTGQKNLSPIVKVNLSNGKSEIIFYPNPVIGNAIKLQLNNMQSGNYTISLTNTMGQMIFKKLILHNGGSAIQSIPVNNLHPGIYQLTITGGGIRFIKQVLKN